MPRKAKTEREKEHAAAARKLRCDALAAAIEDRCRQLGLTRVQACQKAGFRNGECIRSIARGHEPSAVTLARIAEALETTVDALETRIWPERGLSDTTEAQYQPGSRGQVEAPGELISPAAMPIARVPEFGRRRGGAKRPASPMPLYFVDSEMLRRTLVGRSNDFRWADIKGPEMAPDLLDGDRVLIDRRYPDARRSGLYAISSGGGVLARWIDPLPDNERRCRVRCSDPRFLAYEIAEDELRVLGRVVWLSRCL